METTNFQVKSCIHVYGRWLQVSRKRETFTQRGRAVVPTPMLLSSSTRHPKVFEGDESLRVDEQEEDCDHIELQMSLDLCLGELLDTIHRISRENPSLKSLRAQYMTPLTRHLPQSP